MGLSKLTGGHYETVSFTFLCIGLWQGAFAQGFDHKHSVWDSILKKNVKNGLVSYKGIQSEEGSFKQYLESLSKVTEAQYQGFNEKKKSVF